MSFHRCLLVSVVVTVCACSAPGSPARAVRPGLDAFLTEWRHLVAGHRVGLLTNQTGIDRAGTHAVDRFVDAGVQLTTLFSPEHGFRGALDQPDVPHAVDPKTGLPIYSLYGENRAPTASMLDGVDVLVVDLQDIGSRTYTYLSTTLLTMRAAAENGKPVIVLDRPNPIGGTLVQGPVLDSSVASFVGMLSVPLRHGLTIGELALYGNEVLAIGAELTVIPAEGWHRGVWFDQTGLPWVRPSPNMPDLESATHYPGTVLLEATNVSVGRGTPSAFRLVGAPWLDPVQVRAALPGIPGVAIRDTTFTPGAPTDGKYDGVPLTGFVVEVTDRTAYDPTRLGFALLSAIRSVHEDSMTVREPTLRRLTGLPDPLAAVATRAALDEAMTGWEADRARFEAVIARYRLYE